MAQDKGREPVHICPWRVECTVALSSRLGVGAIGTDGVDAFGRSL